MPHGTVVDPRVFVAIAPDGIVTIVAHRAEMGTGVRTSLPMIVAEEMEADWSRVRVQQAHGDEVKFGNQDTDGSRSTRHYLMPMRQIGASARTMLEGAAAKRWGVPATEVKAVNHEVVHSASGRRIGFGDLAADAAKESVPSVEGPEAERPEGFPLSGQRPDQHGRSARHHGGHRALRRRRPPARHEIRRHCPAAGDRRQGRVV
jgi:isoquinoline 1-oxidoreductase beta subunit